MKQNSMITVQPICTVKYFKNGKISSSVFEIKSSDLTVFSDVF